jgi:hypothetical protein
LIPRGAFFGPGRTVVGPCGTHVSGVFFFKQHFFSDIESLDFYLQSQYLSGVNHKNQGFKEAYAWSKNNSLGYSKSSHPAVAASALSLIRDVAMPGMLVSQQRLVSFNDMLESIP